MMPSALARFVRVFCLLLAVLWVWSSVSRHEWFGAVVGLLIGWLHISDYLGGESLGKAEK